MTAEEFKRMFLEALRDDPKFRRAANLMLMTHAAEALHNHYGHDTHDIEMLRVKACNDFLGEETLVEIDKSIEWKEEFPLDWGLHKTDVRAMNFVARVARVSTGVSSNYFLKSLRKDVDYTEEVKRIEEALSYLELTQFIQVKV